MFEGLGSEDVFFRKLYIKCAKSKHLEELARTCRRKVPGYEEDDKAKAWADEQYNPHLSLMYHDCPVVEKEGYIKVQGMAVQLGIDVDGESNMGGWEGGTVVLVPTDKPIDQWIPIAERKLS